MSKLSKLSIAASVAAALWLISAGSAAAAVTVTFLNVDNYAEMPRYDGDKQAILNGLETHFKTLAAGLPAGQDMKVEVLDLGMAGRIDPMHRMYDIRVLRGQADWPKMKLRYTIEEQGKVIKSGEESISDMTYMEHLNRYWRSDSLRYEKRMIDDWFKKTVPVQQVGGVPSANNSAASY